VPHVHANIIKANTHSIRG